MDITNKTRKPLSVPLPGGKKLFLQAGKTGQINPKALQHPPLAKLIEAGDVETGAAGAGRKARGGSASSGPAVGTTSGGNKGGGGAARQSGDR
ncbi:hypothetical protein [Haloferula sp. A504]|uniref:hypothetical protein n=1 Tax=Haloferula sp. A504 TaxID=3373601 RepID=UPI0031C3430B|nr:hypothetical protein [Verrucomicrobiaceae bacterium E54]